MIKRDQNMIAVSAINKISFWFAKIVLVFYGFVSLLGMLWFSININIWSLLTSLMVGLSGIVVAFVKLDKEWYDQKFIIISIIIGALLTFGFGLRYVLPVDTTLSAGIPYFAVTLCYISVITNVVKSRRS